MSRYYVFKVIKTHLGATIPSVMDSTRPRLLENQKEMDLLGLIVFIYWPYVNQFMNVYQDLLLNRKTWVALFNWLLS